MAKSSTVKLPEEIDRIAQGGRILGEILRAVSSQALPGATTKQLSDEADRLIVKAGGRPSFKGYGNKRNPFPAALCVSVNDEVVHGIPSNARTLQAGDIVGLDIGMEYLGFYTDTAVTVGVGEISPLSHRLIHATHASMEAGIARAVAGNHMGDIGAAVQKVGEAAGFTVVRDLVGHGVGYAVHESPEVPNYGMAGSGLVLQEGMVLAIEPMLCEKGYRVVTEDDGWTISTLDGGLSAHFEHTIVVGKDEARILTI